MRTIIFSVMWLAIAFTLSPTSSRADGNSNLDKVATCVQKANDTISDGEKLQQAIKACQSKGALPANPGYGTEIPGQDTLFILRNGDSK